MWGFGLDRADSGQRQVAALVNAVVDLRTPQNAGNFLTSCKPVSFSRTPLHGVSKFGVASGGTSTT